MNSQSPLLSALILIPALGALACLIPCFSATFDKDAKLSRLWAMTNCVISIVVLCALWASIGSNPWHVLGIEESYRWIPALGISFHLKLDGLSLAFTLLTAVVTLAVVAWPTRPVGAGAGWYALLLAAEASVMGAFLATDLVLFYIFFEAMLLPVLGALALWGGPSRISAALRFLIYTMMGSALMFLSIVYLGWRAHSMGELLGGELLFEVTTLSSLRMLSSHEELLLGLAFLLAFAIKIPMVPFHGWLPETYRQAPHGLAAFTAALLGKVGIYAIVRFMWPIFPNFMHSASIYIAAAGAVAVVYGALVALRQRDLRSLLAYSSISHLGFCVLGVAGISHMALTGAVFQAVSHGLVTAALFLTVGGIIDRQGTGEFERLGGLAKSLPVSAFFLMVFCIAGVALPLTSSFVGEFLIIIGSWQGTPLWTGVALLGVVLGAVYTLTAYLKTMFGPLRSEEALGGGDLRGVRVVVLALLAGIIVALGIAPTGLLNTISPAIRAAPSSALIADNGVFVAKKG